MLQDLKWHLRNKCNCSPHEVNKAITTFQTLMILTTENELDNHWQQTKSNSGFKPKVMQYFEKHLLPKFKKHGSVWVLRQAGIQNADKGITKNLSESMNAVFHRLQQWKNVPVDVIVMSMYHLCAFYLRELHRSLYQCGRWTNKDAFEFCKRDPSLMPRLQVVFSPQDIVNQVNMDAYVKPRQQETSLHQDDPKVDSRISLAVSTVNDNRVKLCGNGTFVVNEVSGLKPCAVTLFLKVFCSCSSTKVCYHIAACKMAVCLVPDLQEGKSNLSELARKKGCRKLKDRLVERNQEKRTLTQSK